MDWSVVGRATAVSLPDIPIFQQRASRIEPNNNSISVYRYVGHKKHARPTGLCGSGMRWKDQGAKVILSLRALVQSKGRWQQFWDKIDQYGSHVYV
jgi:hypothetical protein